MGRMQLFYTARQGTEGLNAAVLHSPAGDRRAGHSCFTQPGRGQEAESSCFTQLGRGQADKTQLFCMTQLFYTARQETGGQHAAVAAVLYSWVGDQAGRTQLFDRKQVGNMQLLQLFYTAG
jgi:hypothetical protein